MEPIDLGDGLILRTARPTDSDALAAFFVSVFVPSEPASEPLNIAIHDLMRGDHPTTSAEDFTLVTHGDQIVSGMCLIDQTWTYEGIPFGVGRPEIVATHPNYRGRGLVQRQFAIVHAWSQQRGQKMQVITGIPNFYRQFGYEMAVDLDGGILGYAAVPLKEGEQEPFIVRPATEADIPLLVELTAQTDRRGPIACPMDATAWRYDLTLRNRKSDFYIDTHMIETPDGQTVGFLSHNCHAFQDALYIERFELLPGQSWYHIMPSVARYMMASAERIRPRQSDRFGVALVGGHPAYTVLTDAQVRVRPPYAWYIRIPDLVDFLSIIKPALEARLAASPMIGYSGELKLNLYHEGVMLAFDKGCIMAVEAWKPNPTVHDAPRLPDLTFIQLLMGRRSVDELRHAYADCIVGGHYRPLLDALFPARPSNVIGLI
jgi:hypothetical protein